MHSPNFAEALKVWCKIGLLSFGGPAGQIALMHRILVEEKRWVSEAQYLHALNYCMLLPGPEAQQLATYVGWLLHGVRGGLAAGLLFIIPGAAVILALSYIYAAYQDMPLLSAVFLGIKAAVLVIVVEALLRIGKRILKNGIMQIIALAAFLAIFLGDLPFLLIVFTAGAIGVLGVRSGDTRFAVLSSQAPEDEAAATGTKPARSLATSAAIAIAGVALWAAPIIIAALWLGSEHTFVQEGLFFSKLAVVTFGGAYAVLAYMAQQAVETYAWLTAGEMLDGLGLAESTPGPLIMVTQFVGFLGAYRYPAPLAPGTAALIGSAMTIWVTFVPCFLWIFLGAPYVERLRYNRYLSAALSAITAAVVGVILNLAVWFGVHVLFKEVTTLPVAGLEILAPQWTSLDLPALVLAIIAAIALLRLHIGVVWTVIGGGVLGIAAAEIAALM
ncbi:MAG: chromate efflux transporter [Gammaproteobacteria bacterium]|nr:chromate efflux transporter [Gammaproteobacteria bacterium]